MPPDNARPSTRREVTLAAVLMIMGILGSRVLGLVRVQVQSWWFDPAEVGALRAAFVIPDLLLYIVAGGALRAGFVPLFVGLLEAARDPAARARAWALFSALVTWVALLSVALIAVGMIFTPAIIAPLTGTWSAHGGFTPEQVELTVRLTRLLLPAQIFLLVGGVLSGTLDAMRRSKLTALVPAVYNAAIIVGMALLGGSLGVASAAWGVLVGALVGHFAWQAYALWREGRALDISFRPTLGRGEPLVGEVLRIAAPVVLGLCVAEINLKIAEVVNAQFGASAVAWFDNASKLARLPDGVFGAGLGIAIYPYLSHLAAEGREDDYRRQAGHVLRLAIICTAPLSIWLIVCPQPVVALLFGHGQYGIQDVTETSVLLAGQALGIVPLTLSVILTRMFYARGDTRTPLHCGGWSIVFATAASLLLARSQLRVAGPALAFSFACWFNTVWLLVYYRRRGGLTRARGLVRSAVLSHAAGVLGGGAALLTSTWVGAVMPGGVRAAAVQTGASLLVLLTVYLMLLWWWKLDELTMLWTQVRKRLRPSALGGGETEP